MTDFITKDFYQSVILLTVGLNLNRLERGEGKFVNFVFSDPEYQAEDFIEKFWAGELRLDPKKLINSIKELKTRIYSGA